jgi:hypothetical protein
MQRRVEANNLYANGTVLFSQETIKPADCPISMTTLIQRTRPSKLKIWDDVSESNFLRIPFKDLAANGINADLCCVRLEMFERAMFQPTTISFSLSQALLNMLLEEPRRFITQMDKHSASCKFMSVPMDSRLPLVMFDLTPRKDAISGLITTSMENVNPITVQVSEDMTKEDIDKERKKVSDFVRQKIGSKFLLVEEGNATGFKPAAQTEHLQEEQLIQHQHKRPRYQPPPFRFGAQLPHNQTPSGSGTAPAPTRPNQDPFPNPSVTSGPSIIPHSLNNPQSQTTSHPSLSLTNQTPFSFPSNLQNNVNNSSPSSTLYLQPQTYNSLAPNSLGLTQHSNPLSLDLTNNPPTLARPSNQLSMQSNQQASRMLLNPGLPINPQQTNQLQVPAQPQLLPPFPPPSMAQNPAISGSAQQDSLRSALDQVAGFPLNLRSSTQGQLQNPFQNTSQGSLNLPLTQFNPAFAQTNPALAQTNPALVQANPALVQTNPALVQTNPAFVQANPALVQINPALVQANPALAQTNPAFVQANSAFAQTNLGAAQANSTPSRTDPAIAQSNLALAQANPGFAPANPLLAQTNPGLAQVISTLAQTNPALAQGMATLAQTNPALAQGMSALAQTNPSIAQAMLTNASLWPTLQQSQLDPNMASIVQSMTAILARENARRANTIPTQSQQPPNQTQPSLLLPPYQFPLTQQTPSPLTGPAVGTITDANLANPTSTLYQNPLAMITATPTQQYSTTTTAAEAQAALQNLVPEDAFRVWYSFLCSWIRPDPDVTKWSQQSSQPMHLDQKSVFVASQLRMQSADPDKEKKTKVISSTDWDTNGYHSRAHDTVPLAPSQLPKSTLASLMKLLIENASERCNLSLLRLDQRMLAPMDARLLRIGSSFVLRRVPAVGFLKPTDPNYLWEQERITNLNEQFNHQNRCSGIMEALLMGDPVFAFKLALDMWFLLGNRAADTEAKQTAAYTGLSHVSDLRASTGTIVPEALLQLSTSIEKQQHADPAFFRAGGGGATTSSPPTTQPAAAPLQPAPTPSTATQTPTPTIIQTPIPQQQPIILQLQQPPSQSQWGANAGAGSRSYQQQPNQQLQQQLEQFLQIGGQFQANRGRGGGARGWRGKRRGDS